ncbi:MAG TPA: laccase domain-containing protein [Solirubrobacteraceae bacterium]|nr:laccase domain-containing protein [Solirubrobacteraceae bacterium]
MLRFELPGDGHALFTTRADGNLSTMRGHGHGRGGLERERVCKELGLRWLCAGPQVHGTVVQRVRAQDGEGAGASAGEADGRATILRGGGVMVLTADCLRVIVGSEGGVAALHAGWRGLAAGVLEEGVRALRELDGALTRATVATGAEEEYAGEKNAGKDAADGEIVAIIGPSAGPCCYEVGEEVHSAFADRTAPKRAASTTWSGAAASQHRHGRNLDLPALAAARLTAAGVDRIERVGLCTICDERFFSHRREAANAGRQAGIAWLG